MTAPERDNIDMNMQKPTASESNLSTSDLVDRGQSTPNHGIVKVTEISVDRSAPFGNNDPEKDSIERHYREPPISTMLE